MRVKANVQNIEELVARAKAGEIGAYDSLVLKFQDMAVGYAYSLVGDRHLAEDAAQEAFVEAFCCLSNLQENSAFAGWFKRIVFKQCDRITRKKSLPIVPLDDFLEVISTENIPAEIAEKRELAAQLQAAIAQLSWSERMVLSMFYMGEHSQPQIAQFLELPLSTVKKRLFTARQKLKEKMIEMLQETLEEQRPSRDREFANRVAQDVARSIAEMAAGDLKESEIRRLYPAARYRDSHPIFGLVVSLLTWAYEREANELSIIPNSEGAEVAFKFPQHHETVLTLPASVREAVIERLKDMAGTEMDETSQQQKGSFPVYWSSLDRTFQVEALFTPTLSGAAVSLRLQPA